VACGEIHRLVAAFGAEPEEHAEVADEHEAWQHGDVGEGPAFAVSLHGGEFFGGGFVESLDLFLIEAGRVAKDAGLGRAGDLESKAL
jgi:hypothetical protein